MNVFSLILIYLTSFFNDLPHIEIGVGYTFSATNDPQNPDARLACTGKDMKDKSDYLVAHRTLPCGSKVFIYNLDNGRSIVVKVGDRGPYGKTRKGKYRGVVDMSPLVNKNLRAKGTANVLLMSVN